LLISPYVTRICFLSIPAQRSRCEQILEKQRAAHIKIWPTQSCEKSQKIKTSTTTTPITDMLCCWSTNLLAFFLCHTDSEIKSVVLLLLLLIVVLCAGIYHIPCLLTTFPFFFLRRFNHFLVLVMCCNKVSGVSDKIFLLIVVCLLVLLSFLCTNPFPLHAIVHEFTIIVGVVRISPPVCMRELRG
jgi:hypothetical protein